MISPPSYKWTSCNSQWMDMSHRPHFLVVVQPLLPPLALILCLPQGGESSQHDHGDQWTPITGSSGHLQSNIGVFHPQKTSVPGLRSTNPSHARRFHQTSGHLLSGVPTGECSRQCWTRWSDPWIDFPTSQNLSTGCQHPVWGCNSTSRRGG